jgi:phosphoenolpyruvate carboxykinase (ATP)
MRIAHTRAMIRAALSGALDGVAYEMHPVFNLEVPTSCPDVPPAVLNPRTTWSDEAAYDAQAAKLARMFVDNFGEFEPAAGSEVGAAGPRV